MMRDNRTIRDIPEDDYWRLVTLLGDRNMADELIEKEGRNYQSIILTIYYLEIKRAIKSNPRTRLIIIVCGILLIVFLIQYFVAFDPITL